MSTSARKKIERGIAIACSFSKTCPILILPTAFRIRPRLTIVAAIGAVILMVCAGIFHIARGEGAVISVNIIFALLAVIAAWGRYLKAPIR
ncbi:hypothetical protein Niako_3250 [Niastella koreensis GR20-10]|uniref:DoxX family protein n=1 Tax=Niastella koreensis (strain DSM 17620 / KACC 11465 / NBRC 106392 / GR20-10) TaxID=700598 RepID=G8TGX4_NIAKG|nr:hypothetical protein Niako_3250 [Niastella koreensis GR20-10]